MPTVNKATGRAAQRNPHFWKALKDHHFRGESGLDRTIQSRTLCQDLRHDAYTMISCTQRSGVNTILAKAKPDWRHRHRPHVIRLSRPLHCACYSPRSCIFRHRCATGVRKATSFCQRWFLERVGAIRVRAAAMSLWGAIHVRSCNETANSAGTNSVPGSSWSALRAARGRTAWTKWAAIPRNRPGACNPPTIQQSPPDN